MPSVSNPRGRNICPLTPDSKNLSVLFVRLSLLTLYFFWFFICGIVLKASKEF